MRRTDIQEFRKLMLVIVSNTCEKATEVSSQLVRAKDFLAIVKHWIDDFVLQRDWITLASKYCKRPIVMAL